MKLGIKEKFALVTGGTNGIGNQISLDLARQGVNLIVTSRTKESIENFKKELKQRKVDPSDYSGGASDWFKL